MKFLAVDPGETVGWSLWEDDKPIGGGQHDLKEFIDAVAESAGLARASGPLADELGGWELLVVEDWALYPWELENLAWDKCRTARAIGALELIARITGKQIVLQPAKIKEQAVAAGAEEHFLIPLHENRHQNDSLMHGAFYNASKTKSTTPTLTVIEGGGDGD